MKINETLREKCHMINMLGLFLLASHCAVVVAVGYRTTVGSA